MREFDLIVIGAGPGGYEAALFAAESYGMKTALVEKEALGGTCLNHGCIPTKTLLHSADLYRQMRECTRFGLKAEEISFDMEKIQERKTEVLDQLRSGIEAMMKQRKIEVLRGKGRILSSHTVEVAAETETGLLTETISGKYILIATGSEAFVPPIKGADLPDVMTSDALLEKKDGLYRRLLIIGGGVIGMEFASIYSALGAQVTVVEALPRIIANMDKELSQSLKMLMKKRGVDIITGARVSGITQAEDGSLNCTYTEKEEIKCTQADGILICVGRRPCTEGLFGDGFTLDMEKGRILTDAYYETSVPGVYAIGDATGGMMLAHTATAMGRNAVAYIAYRERIHGNAGEAFRPPVNMAAIPACIYTDPEIASTGLSLEQAKELGIQAASKKIVMSANGKTVLSGQERGFIKVIYEKDTGKILGAVMMCARASDLISEFTEAITGGHTMDEMFSVIRPHPTFSEAVTDACRL